MNIKTKKIEIITEKKNDKEFIEKLQNFGETEIISKRSEKMEDSKKKKIEEKVLKLKEAHKFIKNYQEKGNFITKIIKSFLPRQKKISRKKLNKIKDSNEIIKIVEKILENKKEISELKPKKKAIEEEIDFFTKFSVLNIKKPKNSLKNFNYIAGEISPSKKDKFKKELEKKGFCFSLSFKKSEKARGEIFFLIYQKEKKEIINNLFNKFDVASQEIFWEKLPQKIIKEKRKKVKEIDKKLDYIEKNLKELVSFISKIEILIDYYSWEVKKERFLNAAQNTNQYLSIKAWVPENKIEELKQKFSNCLIKEISLEEGEKPRVIINNGSFRPFEIVTKIYGLPKQNEIDPTLFLAPFFIFQFAFALSDAGYGLILASISYIAKNLSDDKSVKTFFNLFIAGGILTAIVGLFAGTFFGTDLTKGLRLIDPLNNPIDTLIFISYIGAFQIFVGLLIGLVWKIKRGKMKEALAKEGGSILLFIGILTFLFTDQSVYAFLSIGGMVIMGSVFSTANNIGLKLVGGFGSLYSIVGYFSDVLSYSRLLALGLATGIIAMVVNMVAFMFKDMVPIPGLNFLIAGIILVIGHTMNLLINSLGAFIHSARLQFVEFFSKFMEGGGKRFKPFSKNGQFVKLD